MNISDIQTLYAYNRWANQRMFSALEKLSDAQFTASVQSSFPSLRETVFHILGAEWIWLQRWKGMSPRAAVPGANVTPAVLSKLTPVSVSNAEELSTVAGLRSFAGAVDRERQEFLNTLTDDRLHAPLQFSDMAGTPYAEPLVQLMQHLVNHGSYHRGQVITMLRQAGAQTVALDMLYFFRDGGAQAAEARG
jgi:uncharacterized damage-inducible protein DinB